MFNPPHPGLVLSEYLCSIPTAEAAHRLSVDPALLEAVLLGRAPISADLALRLSEALGTHSSFWSGMQMEFDLWQAAQISRPHIEPFEQVA